MFKRILVPLDGSILSERALGPALAIAKQANGEVILLSVPYLKTMLVQERGGYGLLLPPEALKHSRQELTEYLQTIMEDWGHPDCTLRSEILDGDAASAIVDTAIDENVDLIVMSTHGRSGIPRWMLGSVAERVLRSAFCPVLVMRSPDPLSKVLIPLDRSDLAKQALEPGLEVASILGCQVSLLTVMKQVKLHAAEMDRLELVERGLARHFEDSLRAEHEAYLRCIVRDQGRLPACEIEIAVREGLAATSILDFAEKGQVDLIVMATHGRTGLRRWVYGSVTEKVLRGATCSVLIVRPPAHELN